jgi:hypothetical protein
MGDKKGVEERQKKKGKRKKFIIILCWVTRFRL